MNNTHAMWVGTALFIVILACFGSYRLGHAVGQKDMLLRERHLMEKVTETKEKVKNSVTDTTHKAGAAVMNKFRKRETTDTAQ